MRLQDCFVGQTVGFFSKSIGVVTGNILDLFQDKCLQTQLPVWCATVNVEGVDHTFEIQISKLLGELKWKQC